MTNSDLSLIVPISLEALAVGAGDVQAGAKGLIPLADFSKLPYIDKQGQRVNNGPFTSDKALQAAGAFQGATSLTAGIYLHWALPDGLTRGLQNEGEQHVTFPAVPDRWLLSRIVIVGVDTSNPSASVKSWVVESNRLRDSADDTTTTVPLDATKPGQTFAYLGQVFDLEGWKESSTARHLEGLTALGYGEPTFAGYYPNCASVFGYQDTLSDLTDYDPSTSLITYQISGWYSRPEDDPAQQGTIDPSDNPYRWKFSQSGSPSHVVCAGIIQGIPWDPAGTFLDDAEQTLEVAIGNSAAEALSAMIANEPGGTASQDPTSVETILNALQLGWLTKTGQVADSLPQFEEALHQSSFASLSAGSIWQVSTKNVQPNQPQEEVTLPEALAEPLNQLNVLALQLQQMADSIDAARFQLFSDWYKLQFIEYDPEHVPEPLRVDAQEVIELLQQEITELDASLLTTAGPLTSQIETLRTDIEQQLPKNLELRQVAAPRYYQPQDPVLLLSGADVSPTPRYGGDGRFAGDGTLRCRLSTELVTAMNLDENVVKGSAAATLAASALPALADTSGLVFAELNQALLAEAFLLGDSQAGVLTAAVAAQGGTNNPAVLDFTGTEAAIVAGQDDFWSRNPAQGVSFEGTRPSPILLTAWSGTPWLPILLQWEVVFQPYLFLKGTGDSYPSDFITRQFAWDTDDIELSFQGGPPKDIQTYTGTVALSPNAQSDLLQQITAFLDHNPDPELSKLLQQLKQLPILSQGLSGLHSALLMRQEELQLQVADPLATVPPDVVTSVAAGVGANNLWSPLNSNFNPIRAGILQVEKLRLIDVFGRHKNYSAPKAVAAASMVPPGATTPSSSAYLAPRVAQPARLLFRWLSAQDGSVETNSHPASSPIFGWVLANNLNDSVVIYDSTGGARGSVFLRADDSAAVWQAAPGGRFPPGASIDQVFADSPLLGQFAERLASEGAATFLEPFLAALRQTLGFIEPSNYKQDSATAVLIGRPLALARASLSLDVQGTLASDEGWSAFEKTVAGFGKTGTIEREQASWGDVRFPVRLGDLSQINDGLVGYWLDRDGTPSFEQFLSFGAEKSQGGVAPPAFDSITVVSSASTDSGQSLTLLLDPRAEVHATTGILPVKSISIPPDQYQQVLANLSLTFLTAPVLSGSSKVSVPQPREVQGSWSWVSIVDQQWQVTDLDNQQANAVAKLDFPSQTIREGWLRLTRK